MPPRTAKARTSASSTSSAGTTSRSKKAAGLQQPILSFQSQRPTPLDSKSKTKGSKAAATTRGARGKKEEVNISATPSLSELEAEHASNDVVEITDVELSKGGEKEGKAGDEVKRVVPQPEHLDIKSKEWKGLVKHAKAAMGGLEPIHAGPDTHNDIHHILRVFDMTSSYGPCVGITRLQRWERAKKWGLNPPEEIRSILCTKEGGDDVRYRENVLYGWV